MKPLSFIGALTLLILSLTLLHAQEPASPDQPWDDALPMQDGDYILIIGNSLTGHVMETLHGPTFTEDGVKLNTALLYKGGQPLESHYNDEQNLTPEQGGEGYNGGGTPEDSLRNRQLGSMDQVLHGASVDENSIGNNPEDGHPWHVVILQDWRDDLRDYEKFAYYVRRFDQSIRKQGGQTVMFSRFPSYPKEGKIDAYLNQLAKIDESNVRIAEELGADVVPISQIYIEIEKARQANAALAEDDPHKKAFLPDDTENLFMEENDGKWFEPGFLYADGIHQGFVGKGAVYPYAFYSILRRESPIGKPTPKKGWRGFDEAENPELDAWVEEIVWKVIQEREPWAGNPDYEEPARNGAVSAQYDAETGSVTLEIEGDVKGVRLGSPNKQVMKTDAEPQIGGQSPIDADAELIAWYTPEGTLTAGRHDLGPVVEPGTPLEDLYFGFTPGTGGVAQIPVR